MLSLKQASHPFQNEFGEFFGDKKFFSSYQKKKANTIWKTEEKYQALGPQQ